MVKSIQEIPDEVHKFLSIKKIELGKKSLWEVLETYLNDKFKEDLTK
jgi:hypothetical protein